MKQMKTDAQSEKQKTTYLQKCMTAAFPAFSKYAQHAAHPTIMDKLARLNTLSHAESVELRNLLKPTCQKGHSYWHASDDEDNRKHVGD